MTSWIEIRGSKYSADKIAFIREDSSFYQNLGEADRGRFKPKPKPKPESPTWQIGGITSAIDGLPLTIDDSIATEFRAHLPSGFIELRDKNYQSVTLVNMNIIEAVTRGAISAGCSYDFWINLNGNRKKLLTLLLDEHPCDILARSR